MALILYGRLQPRAPLSGPAFQRPGASNGGDRTLQGTSGPVASPTRFRCVKCPTIPSLLLLFRILRSVKLQGKPWQLLGKGTRGCKLVVLPVRE